VRKSNWYGARKRAFWWNEPSFFHMMYPATRTRALTAASTFGNRPCERDVPCSA
jgi:hypothetical protein